jgi:hypothetical protein
MWKSIMKVMKERHNRSLVIPAEIVDDALVSFARSTLLWTRGCNNEATCFTSSSWMAR